MDDISLEETNRIRVSLGLRPIPLQAEQPSRELKQDAAKPANREEARPRKLRKGPRVVHDFQSLDDDTILTLKDTNILDEDDELESEVLVAQERVEHDIKAKEKTNRFATEAEKGFNLGEQTMADGKADGKAAHFELSESETEVADDYEPVKMKKRKNIKKNSRMRDHTDEDGDAVLQRVVLNDEDVLADDSELQRRLNTRRRMKKRLTPEELAREIEESKGEMEIEVEQAVVIDENTEFLSGFKVPKDDPVIQSDENIEEDEVVQRLPQKEPPPQLEEYEDDNDDQEDNGPNFSGGLASTLSFLQSKNAIRVKSSKEVEDQQAHQKLKKELVHDKSKLDNYRPDIKLKYHDEYGRELTPKEAYKQLSHQFHGKAPNKSKMAKKKKQVDEERKREKNERLLDEEGAVNSGVRIQ